MKKIKQVLFRFFKLMRDFYGPRKKLVFILGFFVVSWGLIHLFSLWKDRKTHIYYKEKSIDFRGGRILEDGHGIYRRKNHLLSKKLKNIEEKQKGLLEQIDGLHTALNALKEFQQAKTVQKLDKKPLPLPPSPKPSPLPQPSPPPSPLPSSKSLSGKEVKMGKPTPHTWGRAPAIISFPVSEKEQKKMGVKLPSGSFVRATLLTGVEASESRAIPILLQADYAFIGPNKTRIDLSGCFFLAKSKGNLSIERVEAQVTTVSCVSKSGRMFEKKANGFIADAKDNSFAVIGSVNSKQDRVAIMAFLSSIVEGVGKAIQQAQLSNQTNGVGGTSSLVTGDQVKYMASGGVSNAANLVTQWYLKHAQNLLPTINIGSGQEVWIVMQELVSLPNWYFKKPKKSSPKSGSYAYLSGLLN